jgi:hypothetical protein
MHKLGDMAQAGPWQIILEAVTTGDEATDQVLDWNSANPAAPEGLQYLVATMSVRNTGTTARVITFADFAATGDDGRIRRPPTLAAGDQPVQATIPPGETLTGTIPFLVDVPDRAAIWFESTLLGGSWANVTFATGDASAIPVFDLTSPASLETGASAEQPAAFEEWVVSGDWEVTLDEWVEGEDVLAIAGPELQALARSTPEDVPNWYAVRGRIRNRSPYPAYFSPTALGIADPDGVPWDHILALYPPSPDLSAYLLPGATHDGWAAFARMSYGDVYSDVQRIRVQPNPMMDQPRFIMPPGTAGEAEPEATASVESDGDFQVGDTVVTSEDDVNLRRDPSTDGEIVAVLDRETALQVTGEPTEHDGFTWYGVEVVDTSERGFIASQFLAAE